MAFVSEIVNGAAQELRLSAYNQDLQPEHAEVLLRALNDILIEYEAHGITFAAASSDLALSDTFELSVTRSINGTSGTVDLSRELRRPFEILTAAQCAQRFNRPWPPDMIRRENMARRTISKRARGTIELTADEALGNLSNGYDSHSRSFTG